MGGIKINTRGRYAVMALVELSENDSINPVPLSEIAKRGGISLSYLEQLIAGLRRHGLVRSSRGPGGGYVLAREPEEIYIAEVLFAAEDSLPARKHNGAAVRLNGPTRKLWTDIGQILYLHLSKITLADVLEKKTLSNPHIANLFEKAL